MSKERITQRLRWVEEQLDLVEQKIADIQYLVGLGWRQVANRELRRREELEALQMELLRAIEAQESVG